MMKTIYLIFLLAIITLKPETIVVTDPGKNIGLTLSASEGVPVISATLGNHSLIDASPLEMSIDGISITEGVKIGKIERFKEKETYQVYGAHSIAVNNSNGIRVSLTHIKTGLKYFLEIKVFDTGLAYRFVVPGTESQARIPDESSVFNLPSGSLVWYHNLRMHYEGEYIKKLVDTVPEGQWAAPPLTFKLPDNSGYGSITEANLTGYSGMALQSTGNKGFRLKIGHAHPVSYPYELRYSKEDIERVSRPAVINGTIVTPWRVVLAGKDLNSLINSDVISNLCPPPDKRLFPEGLFTSWIRPGRAVWRYLDGGGDNSLRNMMQFSKLAAELGFEYNILENFWSRWPDDSIRTLVDYSGKLGVDIIVWKHSKELRNSEERKEFLDRVAALGIAGLKIDFFDHEAKEVIDLYEALFKECAARKLVLVLHGANKPTGLQRTYPNVLIYEAVRGMEASRLTNRASHETVLPFTRMLAGGADYSVYHFGERRRNTTWTHQIATAAIFSAPLITYAANPFNILSNPGVEMIKSIPSIWDETIVLPPSEIGELALFARRKGNTWFIAAINGIQPKSLKIPLSFLGNGIYTTLILKDDPQNPASVTIEKGKTGKENFLNIDLCAGGGYMCRLSPE